MSEHTPGPWRVDNEVHGNSILSIKANSERCIYTDIATLWASGLDSALICLDAVSNQTTNHSYKMVADRVRSSIAKATGATQ